MPSLLIWRRKCPKGCACEKIDSLAMMNKLINFFVVANIKREEKFENISIMAILIIIYEVMTRNFQFT